MPYTEHFLERGDVLGKPLENGDIKGAIAAATKDKYLTASGSEAARKRMADILLPIRKTLHIQNSNFR